MLARSHVRTMYTLNQMPCADLQDRPVALRVELGSGRQVWNVSAELRMAQQEALATCKR